MATTETSSPLKIGILGTGNMGRAIGIRYTLVGHPVFFGGRQPTGAPLRTAQLANSLSDSSTAAQHGTLDAAACASDVLIWTMRERNPSAVLSQQGVDALNGKLVIDVNNRDYAEDVLGGPERAGSAWFEKSLGERLQENLPEAYVVKAFNTIAMESLDTSAEKLREAQAQLFVAGVRPSKVRALALQLVEELGFEVVDLGDGTTAVRIAEALGDAVRYIMIENGKGGTANIGVRFLPPPDLGVVGDREQSSYH